jgi:hypothetical protein
VLELLVAGKFHASKRFGDAVRYVVHTLPQLQALADEFMHACRAGKSIRRGERLPHPRRCQMLANLAGISKAEAEFTFGRNLNQ